MSPRPQPPHRDNAPTVTRIRLRYAKRHRMRFSSHRDFQRAFERALRRIETPVAYSSGFTPHPRISYANAAPTGTGSEAEYLEVGLTRTIDLDAFVHDLDATLPDGFAALEAVTATTPDFVERLAASVWHVVLPSVANDEAAEAVAQLLAADHVEVERLTKAGMRRFDARPALLTLTAPTPEELAALPESARQAGEDPGCAILMAVVRHDTPAVRPDDVLAALRHVSGLALPVPPVVTRLAQGPLVPDARSPLASVADPLAPDRAAQSA